VIRSVLYLVASAAIWFAEGTVFSIFLGFSRIQIVLMATVYVTLFVIAVRAIVVMSRQKSELPHWRLLSLGPMLVLVIGSFISLPVIALIALLGAIPQR